MCVRNPLQVVHSVWQAVIFFILTYPFGAERRLVSESENEVNGCQGLQARVNPLTSITNLPVLGNQVLPCSILI